MNLNFDPGRGVAIGIGGIGLGHEFGVVAPTIAIFIEMRVIDVGVKPVEHFPPVGHAVAIIVEFTPGTLGRATAAIIIADAIAVGIPGARIGVRMIFRQIAQAIAIRIAPGAILARGIVGIEPVEYFPPIRQAIAVGIGIVGVIAQAQQPGVGGHSAGAHEEA